MHYGDGVKLSLLPSGRRLIDLYGDDAYRLSDDAFDLVAGYLGRRPVLVGHRVSPDVLRAFSSRDLELRQYPVAVLAESELRAVLEGMSRHLNSMIDIRLKTEVVSVERRDGEYVMTLRDRRGTTVLHTSHIVLATGRRGLADTQRMLQRLEVPLSPPDFSVGVRFEMAAEYLQATGLSHPDMKVTQRDRDADKVKTFCFCGGANGGRVKFTNYQDAFGDEIVTLDGHETLERQAGTRPLSGNFGLMCQAERLDTHAESSAELDQRVLAPYRTLNHGRPVVQTFRAFSARDEHSECWEDISASMPFEPSVDDLLAAPLHRLFTDRQLASLVNGFENVMRPMLALGGYDTAPDLLADEILVIGLEIEFLWSRVAVDDNGETPEPGLFVAGDVAGVAQGVIQAMMMGLRAGRTIGGRFASQHDGAAEGAPGLV